MKLKESISMSCNPKKIWDFWYLVSTDLEWREGFTKAEWTSEPPHGVGSTGVHYHEKLGAYPWTILRWEEGHFFEFIHDPESKLKGSIASYIVEPETDGSLVTLQAKIVGPLIMRIMAPLMRGMMAKGLQNDLKKLKEIMEK